MLLPKPISLIGKKKSIKKRVFGNSSPAAGWEGSDAGVSSASWRLCLRKRQIIWLPCKSPFQNWLTELEIFAIIFSAAIHDYEHTGTTNNFHIQTRWGCWQFVERRQEGAGIEFEKSERYRSPFFCMVTLFLRFWKHELFNKRSTWSASVKI